MPSLESRVQEALKKAGILQHSARFTRIPAVLDRLKLNPDDRAKAQEIAKEWVG